MRFWISFINNLSFKFMHRKCYYVKFLKYMYYKTTLMVK